MKNKIILSVFALFLFSASCGESTACKNLTWEAKESSNQVVGLRISAGDKCENYNDYYEGDLNKIIKQIQSMKIVLNRKCYGMIPGENDADEMEVDCPEFVPETIEFGELSKCKFETPPDENTNCTFYGPELYFIGSEENLIIRWGLLGDNNPQIQYTEKGGNSFSYEKDDIIVEGSFENKTLTTVTIIFTWTEGTEEKTLEFSATVETKE